MRALLPALLALPLALAGCDSSFRFTSNPGFPTTVTGTVIAVQFESSHDPNGVLNTFTAVTLQSVNTTNTFNFCGDQRSQFSLNQEVRVDFNSGVSCATLVVVVVLN
jgi:hypothetical protein